MEQQAAELFNLSKAADISGLSRETLRRYLLQDPKLNHGTKHKPLVDPEEIARHRASQLDPNKANSPRGAGRGRGPAAEPGSLGAIKKKIAEEELALKIEARRIREGELLPADGVKASVDACFRRIRRKAEMIETWADDLAAAAGGDAGALRAALKAKARAFQAELSATVAELADEEDDDEDRAGERAMISEAGQHGAEAS